MEGGELSAAESEEDGEVVGIADLVAETYVCALGFEAEITLVLL